MSVESYSELVSRMAKEIIVVQLPEWQKPRKVSKYDYVKAKVKQLKEFGYESLKFEDAAAQLEHALNGHDMDSGLDVIGMFMKDEVSRPETTNSQPNEGKVG